MSTSLANLSLSESSSTPMASSTVDTTNFSRGVLSDALEGVGHTPLVNLQNLRREEGLECNLSEYPGSLPRDRVGGWRHWASGKGDRVVGKLVSE